MENGHGRTKEASTSTTTMVKTEGIIAPMTMTSNGFGELLVSVRAQVMAWDDRYCGWLPLEGGGVSNIRLYQRINNNGMGSSIASTSDDEKHRPIGPTSSAPKFEYIIHGEKLEDRKVNLHCLLSKDINYRQVMPTFHHWQIDERKFGLKFMTSYEACKFHNRLQKAVEHLFRQSKSSSGDSNVEADDLEDDVFVPVDLPLSRAESWESGSTMAGGLPISITAAASMTIAGPSTSLLRTSFPTYSSTTVPAIVHQPTSIMSFGRKKKKSTASTTAVVEQSSTTKLPGRTPTWPKTPAELTLSAGAAVASTSSTSSGYQQQQQYPFAYFQKEPSTATVHLGKPTISSSSSSKYGLQASASFGQLSSFPSRSVSIAAAAAARSSALEKRESIGSLKLSLVHQQVPLPSASGSSSRRNRKTKSITIGGGGGGASPLDVLRRERCFYCKSYYVERDNRRGACPDAPDPCSKWIRRLTCIWCAECLLYCCCRGDWNDYGDGESPLPRDADVCSCAADDPSRGQRWTLLTVLAVFVPCLWCYPPLTVCHRTCRRRYRLFGGRHVPIGSSSIGAAVGSSGYASGGAGRSSSIGCGGGGGGRASMTTPEASALYK